MNFRVETNSEPVYNRMAVFILFCLLWWSNKSVMYLMN